MTNLSEEDCCGATAADGAATTSTGATAGLEAVAGSRLDTITAPIRQVRVANFSSLRLWETGAGDAAADRDGDHELDGATTAVAAAGAVAGLVTDEASGLDTIAAPTRQVRVANFSPDCC